MSAVPSYLSLVGAGGAEERRHWVTAAQLATATEKSLRTIQWSCQHGDLRHCHRFERNPDGGRDILKIDLAHAPERYRLAFAQSKSTEVGAESLKLTDKQVSKAAAMASLIQEVEAYVSDPNVRNSGNKQNDLVKAFLDARRVKHPDTPSLRTYFRNKAKWNEGGRKIAALADQRAMPGKGVRVEFSEEAFTFFSSVYLVQGEPKARDCYRMLQAKAHDQGWMVPSFDTVMRTLKLRVPKAKIVELRQGKEARQNRCDPYLIREWSTLGINERWVSDHCLIDVIGIDDLPGGDGEPRRMWLTTWMDEGSRFVIHWRIHRGPNAREVLASFYHAVLAGGKPLNILIDNGKEYRCKQFAGGRRWRDEVVRLQVDETAVRPVLMDLGITPHFAEAFGARSKIVEPWHGHFVKDDFARQLPGFCGGNSQEKPEQLYGFKSEKGLVQKRELLHWSLLVEMLGQAIQGYNLASHESLGGKCPAIVRQERPWTKEHVDPRRLAKLFQDKREKTVGRMGIELDGAAYGVGNLELIRRQGEKVHVHMDLFGQIGTVYVYEPNGRFICTAENAGRVDAMATREDLAEARRVVKLARKNADQWANEIMPVITAVDPVEKIALLKRHGEIQLEAQGYNPAELLAGDTAPIKPDFNQQTNDLPPAHSLPASHERPSNGLRLTGGDAGQDEVETERMDAPASGTADGMLPDNILDAFSAG